MKEIERKYLLNKSILKFLKNTPAQCQKITQFYTKVTEEKSVRYRQYNGKYIHCIKHGTGGIREETEKEIDAKEFEKYRKKHIGSPVKKLRCLLQIDGFEYSIDIYKKSLAGLHIMEVKFETLKEYENFVLPSILKPYVKYEVTQDEAYKNKNLSLFGLPCSKKNPHKLTVTKTLMDIFESYMKEILLYRAKVLEYGTEEDLHKLRINLRKTIVIMGEFKLVFKDYEKLREHKKALKSIIDHSNAKRDLDVLKEKLTDSQESTNIKYHKVVNILLNNINEELLTEEEKFMDFLKSPSSKSALKRWKKSIKNMDDSDISIYGRYMTDPVYKHVIFQRFLKIKKQIHTLDVNDNTGITLHHLRISFKNMRYLLETFQNRYEKKKSKKLLYEIKQLQDFLGLFHDTQEQRKLFKNLYEHHENKKMRSFIKDVLISQLKTYQKKEIHKIEKQLKSFLMKEDMYRKIFT